MFEPVKNELPVNLILTIVFEVDVAEEIVAFVVESETVSPTVNVPFESVDSRKTVDVFEYVLIVAVSPSKSVNVSLAVNVPDTSDSSRVTKVLPKFSLCVPHGVIRCVCSVVTTVHIVSFL